MTKKKTSKKKVQAIELDAPDAGWNTPIVVEEKLIQVSEKDIIKKDLKEIQDKLNSASQIKGRTELLTSQMNLQIKLKNL